MAKRTGLARTEALIENLKRDINLGGSTVRTKKVVTVITGTKTLTAEDSGTLFMVQASGDAAYTITLPSASTSAGVYFTFIMGNTASENVLIDSGTGNGIRGMTVGAATEANISNNLIRVVGGTSIRGDRVDLHCDGSRYWCHNFQQADDAVIGANS